VSDDPRGGIYYMKTARKIVKKKQKKTHNTKRLLFLIPIVLLTCAIIIIPQIEVKGIKARIAEEISSQLQGEVVISRASLTLLPWPHVTLKEVKIQSPRWGGGTVAMVRVYPRLIPLLKKKLSVKRLVVWGAVLNLTLPERAIERNKDIASRINRDVARMIPSVVFKGGVVHILRTAQQEPFFAIEDVTGNLSSQQDGEVRLAVGFSCPGAERIELRLSAWAQDQGETSCSFLATGKNVTIEKIRGAALEMLGKHNKSVRRVFHIFQGGEVSWITFHGTGKDFKEAFDFKRNVRIRGTIAAGRILAPPADLPLEEASGEFEIEEAMLRCWDADLRLGRSIGKKGTMVVGLIREREPFHLDIMLDATAEDLTSYLPMIIKEDDLRKEIKSFQEAHGRGKGRLILGETIHNIHSQVEVESFNVSFRHAHSPGTISLEGGQLTLNNGESTWRADAIRWKGCQWENVEGGISFEKQGIEITVSTADLCGLHCTGSMTTSGGVVTHAFQFRAEEAELASTLLCLWDKDARIEGTFRFEGDMWAEGKQDPLREASEGSLMFISEDGRIYRWTLLSQLFGMLNIVGLFEGKFPDFTQKGFQYDTFVITGELRDGYIYLKEAVIDGPSMKIVGEGKIDLVKGEADIAVLVAPLKTIDTVLKHIPIVGRIITGKNGTFISVPFSVKGPIDDPKVTLLPPEAVGSGLWGVLKRTLQVPVDAVKTIISKK
jgi:hypothetical protein